MATIQVRKYATIEEMKNDNNLIVGEVVEIIGYYMIDDGAVHKRIISTSNDGTGVLLNNSLWANLIYKDYLNVCHLGAKGDGNFDDFEIINQALIHDKNIFFPKGIYKISQSLTLNNHNLKGDSAVGGNFGSSMGNWDISCEGGKNGIFIEGGRYNNFILYSESNSGIEFNIIASGNKIFMRNPDNDAIPETLDNEIIYTSGGHIYKRDPFKLNKIQEVISNDSSVSLQANPIDIFIIKNNNTKTRSMNLQCLAYIPIGTKFEIIVLENNNAGFVLYAPTGYVLKGDIGIFGNYVKGLHRLEVYKVSNTEALLFRKDTVSI